MKCYVLRPHMVRSVRSCPARTGEAWEQERQRPGRRRRLSDVDVGMDVAVDDNGDGSCEDEDVEDDGDDSEEEDDGV